MTTLQTSTPLSRYAATSDVSFGGFAGGVLRGSLSDSLTLLSAFPPAQAYSPNARIEIHQDVRARLSRQYPIPSLSFQFMEPSITDQANPKWESIETLGRSEAFMSYSGTENRTVSLELIFAASAMQSDRGSPAMAFRAVKWLQSLAYPNASKDQRLLYPPALCLLVLGKFISMRCVMQGCQITYEGPFVGVNNPHEYPYIAKASVEFVEVNRAMKTSEDIWIPNANGSRPN